MVEGVGPMSMVLLLYLLVTLYYILTGKLDVAFPETHETQQPHDRRHTQ